MKKILSFILVFIFVSSVLVGCNKNSVTSSAVPSDSASVASNSVDSVADLQSFLSSITTAIGFEGTIPFAKEDLAASGVVNADNIVAMVGVQSNIYTEDGGMILIIETTALSVDVVKSELEAFRTAQVEFLELYPEFANGVANMKEARIATKGNLVIFASSPTGHEGGYAAIDAAIEMVFA